MPFVDDDQAHGIPPLKWQVEHIEEHLDAFHNHAGTDLSVTEYLYTYSTYKDGEIYERLCADLGITPRTGPTEGNTVTDTTETGLSPSDHQRLMMQLQLGMEEDGSDLSDARRAEIEAQLGGPTAEAPEEQAEPTNPEEQAEPTNAGLPAGGLQDMIQQAVAQAIGQAVPAQSLEDVLLAIDPKDSDSALLLMEWLQGTGRLNVVATLNGKGGYLWHYQEPKGATKEGYTPGGTQGGRMVDAALQQTKESGGKPKHSGMCDKCWSAVEQLDDGTVVTDDENHNAVCSQGGAHTFNA